MRRKAESAEKTKRLLNYRRAFEENYDVRFFNVSAEDIAENIVFSNFLAANSRIVYQRHFEVCKIMITHKGMLRLLAKLSKDAPVVKTVTITHLDEPSLYIPSEKDILLIIQVANTFVKDDQNPAQLHAKLRYRHASAFIDKLHVCRLKQDLDKLLNLALFLVVKIHQSKLILHSFISLFIALYVLSTMTEGINR